MLTLTREQQAAVQAAKGAPVFVVDPETAEEFELRPRKPLAARLSPQEGIEIASDICGGDARIAGTRIPVWGLVQSRRLGMSDAELLRCYPSLRADDLDHAWAYAQAHPQEIDRQIVDNETA